MAAPQQCRGILLGGCRIICIRKGIKMVKMFLSDKFISVGIRIHFSTSGSGKTHES